MIRRILRLIRNIAAALGLLMILVTITPLVRWYALWLAGPWYESRGDTLIVLGADDPSNGVIGQATYWRSVYAVMAWREGGFRRIVVSGDRGIAESMRDLLISQHVPADRILLENRSAHPPVKTPSSRRPSCAEFPAARSCSPAISTCIGASALFKRPASTSLPGRFPTP